MKVLGIETSCDETAAAVIEDGRTIITNIISSSAAMHEATGGIIPEMAARAQVTSIIPVIEKSLHNHSLDRDIDAIAITVGPGLIGSLLVGVETAKTLSMLSGIPLVPVNHVLAHLYANFLNTDSLPQFPALGLVVSGGHTELFLMEKINKLKWIAGTLDDAAGEAFDKTARLLGLGFPGGPAIAAKAEEFRIKKQELRMNLPRPMIHDKSLNFSFSGLKTAVWREVKKLQDSNNLTPENIQNISFEIEEAITDVLTEKTLRAAREHNVKSILIGGGVAANKRLTEKFHFKIQNSKYKIDLYIPLPKLCTDNAAYIASFATFNYHPVDWKKIEARPDLEVEGSFGLD